MDRKGMVLYDYGSVGELLGELLRGLSTADLNAQPHPDCNSMGWTVWHLTRLPDDVFFSLLGQDQLWTAGQAGAEASTAAGSREDRLARSR